MRVCDTSALHSRRFTVLCDWAVNQARDNLAVINKTTFIGNGKQGRHFGMFGDHSKIGVFQYCDLDGQHEEYESMIHVFSGVKVQMDELKPKPSWTIEGNHNE